MKKIKIIFCLFSMAILLVLLCSILRPANTIIFTKKEIPTIYRVPQIMVEVQDDISKKYILITGAYESKYSLDHLRFDHWWLGTFGVYLMIAEDQIKKGLLCLEEVTNIQNCYDVQITSGSVSAEGIKDLRLSLETIDEKITIDLNKIDFSIALTVDNIITDYMQLINNNSTESQSIN